MLVVAGFSTASHAQTPQPGLQLSASKIEFSETAVDSQSAAQTVTVSNPTQSQVTLTQILTSGIDFSEKHDCGQALAPGAQCTIQIFFKPAISGPRNGSLVVMGSDAASPHLLSLSGAGK